MINLDTRLLDKTSPDGLYLLCRIAAYMNANRFCFPSNKSLAKATGFSESKVNRVKKELIEQGLMSCEFRFRDDKSQTSSIYKIKTGLISVFVRGDEMSELTPPLVTNDTPSVVSNDTPPLSLVTTREVLEDLSITQFEVLKDSETCVSGAFLSDDEIEDLENKIAASQQKINPTPRVAPPPRPKAKRAKVYDPTPIPPMWQEYEKRFADLNQGEPPVFHKKYLRSLKTLFAVLRERTIKKGIVPLNDVQPWCDFLDMAVQHLKNNPKETYLRGRFDPIGIEAEFNKWITTLNNRPKTDAEKWMDFARRNGVL